MIYNGSHSNMIRSVDDKYILDQMIDIGRPNHDWPPFKATLACISSLGRHVYKHGGALESLTLTNNFYHKDNYEYDEEDDEDDVIDRNSVPHPLIPVLLRRGAQLRELSICGFLANDTAKFLNVLDRSRLRSIRVHNHHVVLDDEVPSFIVDFVRRGCFKLEHFEYFCSRHRFISPVLAALEMSTRSLTHLNIRAHSWDISDKEAIEVLADHLSKIANANKDTIEAIHINGPSEESLLAVLFGREVDSIKTAEDIGYLDHVCKQRYCIPLANMMWSSLPLLFWLRVRPFLSRLANETDNHKLVATLFAELCTSLNKHNVCAIRNCLSAVAHRCYSGTVACLDLISDIIIRHIDQSIELNLVSKEYDFQLVVSAACGVLQRELRPALARAVHRALVCNIEPIKIRKYGGLSHVLNVGAEGGPFLDINRKLCGHGDPIFFDIMKEEEINFTTVKSLIAYPSFNSILCVGKSGSAIGAVLARMVSLKDDITLEIASNMLACTAPRPTRQAALQDVCKNTELVLQLLAPKFARLLVRLAEDDWSLIFSENLLQYFYDHDRFDLLEDLLQQIAKGPLGLGSVSVKHKIEMVDILWRYVFAWGDEENFAWMARMTVRRFPGSVPEWLADFADGKMLPEHVDFAWDLKLIRKSLQKLRIA
jgi:hypothetical protein